MVPYLKGGAFMIYVTTKEAASLCGVTSRSIQLKANAKQLPSISDGKKMLIPLGSLPEEAQVSYVRSSKKKLEHSDLQGLCPAAVTAADSTTLSIGIENLAAVTKNQRDLDVWNMAQRKPLRMNTTTWYDKVANQFGVSIQTVFRIVKRYNELGTSPQPSLYTGKQLSSWDDEAIQFLQGYYLKAIKEVGDCTKLTAYRALQDEAKKHGWKIGSRSSAYVHLNNLSPLLETHARGGALAIDNSRPA
jgi:putative transposase